MTPKGHDRLECLAPGCRNIIEQTRSGRRRKYCSDACGVRYRKFRSAHPEAIDNDAYAIAVAEQYAQHAGQLTRTIRDGQPVAALQLLVTCEQDSRDLRAAVVQQARDRKIKSADIATALHISADTLSRLMTAEHISSRREHRTTPTTPPPAPAPPPQSGPSAGTSGPHQRYPRPAPISPPRPAGGFPDTDNGPPADGPAATFARALSHLQRTSDKTLRALGQEARVDPSYVSRVLSGERLPSWKVTRKVASACGGDPEEQRPLWDAARGYRVVQPASLHAALRGLHLSAACPDATLIRQRTHNTVSVEDITGMLNGTRVPDWDLVDHLVGARHGQADTIRPLWDAARTTAGPNAAQPGPPAFESTLPAGAFG
ncbi:helix-turn-helix domain-containing protein [Streptomyces sp. NPDC060064]|uniref:helix-turn-helix domain-containing protein n=1 Tax=Streptomyces sp. NPDC060064 TaxID=3347049 RepID=UPI0036BE075F